jgi:hypothetical protein
MQANVTKLVETTSLLEELIAFELAANVENVEVYTASTSIETSSTLQRLQVTLTETMKITQEARERHQLAVNEFKNVCILFGENDDMANTLDTERSFQ